MNGDLKDLLRQVTRAAEDARALEGRLPPGRTQDVAETAKRKLQQLRDGLEDEIGQLEMYERVDL